MLSLPFVSWIVLSNSGALFAAIGAEDYSNIYGGYTLYNFLSFVQENGHGILGFPAMLLMVAMVAAALFQLVFLVRTIVKPVGEKGYLKLYSNCQVAMLFTFFVPLATIFYLLHVRGYAGGPYGDRADRLRHLAQGVQVPQRGVVPDLLYDDIRRRPCVQRRRVPGAG